MFTIIIILFAIASVSLLYKWNYHRTAPNVDNLPKINFWINKLFLFGLIFPLRQRPHNEIDNSKRKNANIALYIFYISFTLIMILSSFTK